MSTIHDPWPVMLEKYPLLYRECIPTVGDGWFDLIDKLSAKIEKLIEAMPEENREYVSAAQVKEKFGGLRFYMHFTSPEIEELIEKAEEESQNLCEVCGLFGKLRKGGWLKTLCDAHAIGRP